MDKNIEELSKNKERWYSYIQGTNAALEIGRERNVGDLMRGLWLKV